MSVVSEVTTALITFLMPWPSSPGLTTPIKGTGTVVELRHPDLRDDLRSATVLRRGLFIDSGIRGLEVRVQGLGIQV